MIWVTIAFSFPTMVITRTARSRFSLIPLSQKKQLDFQKKPSEMVTGDTQMTRSGYGQGVTTKHPLALRGAFWAPLWCASDTRMTRMTRTILVIFAVCRCLWKFCATPVRNPKTTELVLVVLWDALFSPQPVGAHSWRSALINANQPNYQLPFPFSWDIYGFPFPLSWESSPTICKYEASNNSGKCLRMRQFAGAAHSVLWTNVVPPWDNK